MNREKHIGELSGKLLVFGGVYSNVQSLAKMKALAEQEQIQPHNILCTGDIVGYCAQPEESLQLIREWGIHSIAGNVELQIRNGEEDCGCNFDEESRCDVFSRQWYPYAYHSVSEEMKIWLNTLPEFIRFKYADYEGLMLHGSYKNTSEFIFHSTRWEVKESIFEETNSNLIIAGHCGLPFSCSEGNHHWLNAGVIGMPANDGTSRVWYMILNDEKGQLNYSHQSYEYDYKTTAKLMKDNNLPQTYADTLKTGIWDNCEILPEKETKDQGMEIRFH